MTKRARSLASVVIAALAAWVYSRLAGEWSVGYFAGLAVVIVVVGLPLTAFVELPEDRFPRLRRSRG